MQFINKAFPIPQKLKDREAGGNGIFVALVVSIGFASIPAYVAAFMVKERQESLKH